MSKLVQHFDILTKQGMQVIPLFANSKIPSEKRWTKDEYDLKKMRSIIIANPNYNLGLRLGDIVDVEGDSDLANQIINDIIGDYPHPLYRSNKSTHHLFLSPNKKLRRIVHDNIEFRGFGHQSVLPPSKLKDGTVYKWMSNFHFPIPKMPSNLLAFLNKITHTQNNQNLKPNHVKIKCSSCGQDVFIHQKRLNLELITFKQFDQMWQCQVCRKIDTRKICRKIRKSLN